MRRMWRGLPRLLLRLRRLLNGMGMKLMLRRILYLLDIRRRRLLEILRLVHVLELQSLLLSQFGRRLLLDQLHRLLNRLLMGHMSRLVLGRPLEVQVREHALGALHVQRLHQLLLLGGPLRVLRLLRLERLLRDEQLLGLLFLLRQEAPLDLVHALGVLPRLLGLPLLERLELRRPLPRQLARPLPLRRQRLEVPVHDPRRLREQVQLVAVVAEPGRHAREERRGGPLAPDVRLGQPDDLFPERRDRAVWVCQDGCFVLRQVLQRGNLPNVRFDFHNEV